MSWWLRSAAAVLGQRVSVAPEPPPPSFSPADLGDLRLWLDASDTNTITDDDSAVTQWVSKDPNQRVFVQTDSDRRPETNNETLNGRNVLSLDSDFMVSDDAASEWTFLHDGTDYHAWFIVQSSSTTTDRWVLATHTLTGTRRGALLGQNNAVSTPHRRFYGLIGNGSSSYIAAATGPNRSWEFGWTAVQVRVQPTQATLNQRIVHRIDDGAENSGGENSGAPTTSAPVATLRVGSNGSNAQRWSGAMAEIIVAVEPTTEEVASVRAYLAEKWDMPL